MLLTDEEIREILGVNAEFCPQIEYARDIESAVLEKLKAQEPDKTKIECVTGAIYKHISGELYPREVIAAAQYIVHRYCTPPDDVVRDAARYRWLRDNHNHWSWKPSQYNKDIVSGFTHCDTGYLGYALQEAIDAAMKEMK